MGRSRTPDLPADEGMRVLAAYRNRHPRAWRRIAPLLGFPLDPDGPGGRDALAQVRVVAFRRESTSDDGRRTPSLPSALVFLAAVWLGFAPFVLGCSVSAPHATVNELVVGSVLLLLATSSALLTYRQRRGDASLR